jgi:hypothetical protein
MTRSLFVALSIVAVSTVAHADRIKVAVVPGLAVNLDAARVDALSQDLAQALQTELDIDAIGGLEVRRLLPADGLPADCVTSAACIADVAKRTGATQLLFVVMVDSGGAVQIDSTWIASATGQQVSRPAIDLTSSIDAAAKEKFQSVARQLLPDAPVRRKPASQATLKLDTKMTEATPRHVTRPAYITGAAALTGLGAGIAFGLATRSKYNSCDADPMKCTQSQRDSIRNFGIVADASFLVATGAAIATVVLYVTSSEGPHVVVSPTAEGAGAGVTWLGRF